MVSSVVGFYSSPLFTSLLPRAKDTNLTQVPLSHATSKSCRAPRLPLSDLLSLPVISDHCKLRIAARPELGAACVLTHAR